MTSHSCEELDAPPRVRVPRYRSETPTVSFYLGDEKRRSGAEDSWSRSTELHSFSQADRQSHSSATSDRIFSSSTDKLIGHTPERQPPPLPERPLHSIGAERLFSTPERRVPSSDRQKYSTPERHSRINVTPERLIHSGATPERPTHPGGTPERLVHIGPSPTSTLERQKLSAANRRQNFASGSSTLMSGKNIRSCEV